MKIIIQNHRASPQDGVFADLDGVTGDDSAATETDPVSKPEAGGGGHGAEDAGGGAAQRVGAGGAIESHAATEGNGRTGITATDRMTEK